MHGKYELKPDEERAPRVEFVDDDVDEENRSIQEINNEHVNEFNENENNNDTKDYN